MHPMLKAVGGAIALLQFACVVQSIDLDLLNKQATYLDAKVGSYAVFNCPLDFPQDIEIPYTLNWNKEVTKSILPYKYISLLSDRCNEEGHIYIF